MLIVFFQNRSEVWNALSTRVVGKARGWGRYEGLMEMFEMTLCRRGRRLIALQLVEGAQQNDHNLVNIRVLKLLVRNS